MIARFSHLAGILKEALFPAKCLHCETACPWPSRSSQTFASAGFLCPKCHAQMEWIQPPLCTHCGRPFESDQGVDHICGSCRNKVFAFQSARAAGLYAGSLKSLIHQYKYKRCEPLAGPLGLLLWEAFCRYWAMDAVDLIVPVPLHPRRMRKRGFNQAGLLLQSWSRLAAKQGLGDNRLHIQNDMLVRRRYTAPQTGLDNKARQDNVRNAFGMGRCSANGLHVLLVDDVLTTGATAQACAQVLKRNGAASVKLLTLARAVHYR